jgi:hypothetical protein
MAQFTPIVELRPHVLHRCFVKCHLFCLDNRIRFIPEGNYHFDPVFETGQAEGHS